MFSFSGSDFVATDFFCFIFSSKTKKGLCRGKSANRGLGALAGAGSAVMVYLRLLYFPVAQFKFFSAKFVNRGDGFPLKVKIDVLEIPKKGFNFFMSWPDNATTAPGAGLHPKVGLFNHDLCARIC